MITKLFTRLSSTSIGFALQHYFSTFSPKSHASLSSNRCLHPPSASQKKSCPPPPAPTPSLPSLPPFATPKRSPSHQNLLLLTTSRPRRRTSAEHASAEHARLTTLSLAHTSPHPRHAVLGVDEVGTGSLAGPVIAAAVCFASGAPLLEGLGDSKKLPPRRRQELAARILDLAARGEASVGLGAASVAEVDYWNVREARRRAAERAVDDVCRAFACVLVDGGDIGVRAGGRAEMRFLPGGDGLCESVAAASVVAKVVRDAIMTELGGRVAGYGIERNAGYGTKEHLAAIRELGAVPGLHRWSFKPVREAFVNEGYVV